jgi:sec-independent protein translocase protein TatA
MAFRASLLPERISMEVLIVLAIALLVFGSSKLPKLARSAGQAKNEYKQGLAVGPKDDDSDASRPR